MKILWVKAGAGSSGQQGKIPSHHLLKELARQHAVKLLSFKSVRRAKEVWVVLKLHLKKVSEDFASGGGTLDHRAALG